MDFLNAGINKDNRQLFDLVATHQPENVLDEVKIILNMISPDFNIAPVNHAFAITSDLYNGCFPGYKSCNIEYHDLRHITHTFLVMARLIHGAVCDGEDLNNRLIALGLITALLHDSGYIQEDFDNEGTGAKYTTSHVRRSMDFLKRHGAQLELSDDEITAGRAMILCTDLAVDINSIEFPSGRVELLGKMLGTADLLAQMADRTYLEKLLFLYREFKEAGVGGYESELDLLKKTVGFYDYIGHRIETALDATDRYMISHFDSRWNIHKNLYHEAIEKQKEYLKGILEMPDFDHRDYLRRNRIVNLVREKYRTIF